MNHKIMGMCWMSVLLIIFYTWTMLLHQNFTVTTSKPVYTFFCYHIKTWTFFCLNGRH